MIKVLLFLISVFIINFLLAQQPTVKQVIDGKQGRIPQDKSYIYTLPFELGTKRRLIQGAYSKLSHKGEIALDFNVKVGTIICAARSGVVVASYGESNKGGMSNEYLNDGNHIIIEHNDGSRALYWHLMYKGNLVNVGDTVITGQAIGKSGNTGYSAFPHLHFEINAKTADGSFQQVPARFFTNKGIKYLRPLKKYKVVKRSED